MDEFVKTVFNNAILREQLARKMYLELAEKAAGELSKLFVQLAEEESIHENLFKKMSIEILNRVNSGQLSNLNMLKGVKKSSMGFKDAKAINEALDYAIHEEEKAYEDYSVLIPYTNNGEMRDALEAMALQEKNHKMMLQKVKNDFNEADWDVQ